MPDARFLLEAHGTETILVNDRLRLLLFRTGQQTVALFTATSSELADKPMTVKLPIAPDRVTILSKQGIRLWPQPEEYHLPGAGPGYYEAPQEVVRVEDNLLCVPVTTGLVYCLTKAPAYIISGPGMSPEEFRRHLLRAQCLGASGQCHQEP